jgi:hypothetical protein
MAAPRASLSRGLKPARVGEDRARSHTGHRRSRLSDLVEAMRSQIAARTAVVIVGTGVSVAGSDRAPTASWNGFIESGLKRAVAFNPSLPSKWYEHLRADLSFATEEDYLPGTFAVADQITSALGGNDGGEFKAWLRDDIGSLKVAGPEAHALISAIGSLGIPILTTNYDGLLEEALRRVTTTLHDTSNSQLVLQGAISNVLHLHGYWDAPETVVFGGLSYGAMLGNEASIAIEHMLVGARSIIFVGCGEGLADPNFESLRAWLSQLFSDSEMRHYRLCRSSEVKKLAQLHQAERIIPVSYGDTYGDLEPFLRSLAPSDAAALVPTWQLTPSIQQLAIEAIDLRVRSETIFSEHLGDVDSRPLAEILIPPVLLPVTQAQFVQSGDLDEEHRPKRCDAAADIQEHSLLLIAAEETSGLTSALEWIAARAAKMLDVAPVMVDFRQLGTGHLPLERQVRKELRLAGVSLAPSDSLPTMALALDNLSVRPEKILYRVIDELKDPHYAFAVIGCRQGAEADLMERLAEAGLVPALRYIGRLNGADATKMAMLVEPSRAEKLASKAIGIANTEHLPRTPLTIGLLLCMLLHGESLLATASPTALLDGYVNLLLGRGDPHDDARFALDSLEKSDILASLAERFVLDRTGSLSEHVALECLESYFTEVGWTEDPIDVLGNFTRRYLLSVRNGQVRFAQSSYLHLFAAKRAIESESFRKMLYDDPLYFSPILRHYAALTRNDPEVLRRVEDLLGAAGTATMTGKAFGIVDETDVPPGPGSIDELVASLSLSAREDLDTDAEASGSKSNDLARRADDWLDRVADSDHEPFPIEEISDAPPVIQVMAALTLASNVLRDSELVKDLDLKQRVLKRTLRIWGHFVDLLEVDEDFQALWRALAEAVFVGHDISEQKKRNVVDQFCDMAPVLMGLGGIAAYLSSRKLLRALAECFQCEDFVTDSASSVMGALMAFDIQDPGWTKYFAQVQADHSHVKAVHVVMRELGKLAYYFNRLSQEDAARLLQFLSNEYVEDLPPASPALRKTNVAKISQQLRKNRNLLTAKRGGRRVTDFRDELES